MNYIHNPWRLRKLSQIVNSIFRIVWILIIQQPFAGSQERLIYNDYIIGDPIIISSGQIFKLEVGSTARFPCRVSNLGPLVLIWKHGTRVLTAGVGAGTMHIKKDDRLHLTGTDLVIQNVTEEDAGIFTCELDTDDAIPLSVTHHLQILVSPKLLKHPATGHLVVKKGSTVSLKCQASGFPEPKISWSKKNGVLMSGKKYYDGPIYTIFNISRHESGVYRCVASNGVGQPVEEDIYLDVLYSPEVVAELGVVHSGVDFQASLSCIVNANPASVVRWYRNSMLLENDNNFMMESKGTLYTLILRKVRRENFGRFSCSASNEFGKQMAHISVTGIPKAPVFQQPSLSKSSTSYTLLWTTESYSMILEHRLIYRKFEESQESDVFYVWTTLNLIPDSQQEINHNMTYILDNLDEDSKYEAKVSSLNEFGWSDQSTDYTFFTSSTADTPKQLPIEPEKTPAPSTEFRFSSAGSYKMSFALIVVLVSSIC